MSVDRLNTTAARRVNETWGQIRAESVRSTPARSGAVAQLRIRHDRLARLISVDNEDVRPWIPPRLFRKSPQDAGYQRVAKVLGVEPRSDAFFDIQGFAVGGCLGTDGHTQRTMLRAPERRGFQLRLELPQAVESAAASAARALFVLPLTERVYVSLA